MTTKNRIIKHQVNEKDLSVMLQYAILGLSAEKIAAKMNKRFCADTIRKHLSTYKINKHVLDEPKIMNYLKDFDTSYGAGIEV